MALVEGKSYMDWVKGVYKGLGGPGDFFPYINLWVHPMLTTLADLLRR